VDKIERRKFLKVTGAGVAGAAALSALGPLATLVASLKDGVLHFRAVTGLPNSPLPAYASYVLEGRVNLQTKSGVMTRSLMAGAPEAMSEIAFPGVARSATVSNVRVTDRVVRITGRIDDPAQLLKGERPTAEITLDRSKGLAWAQFFGSDVTMRLEYTEV
jgi:hypothetical protein